MKSKVVKKETELAGKTISLETGKLAPQADQAILARLGDTVVLVAVVSSEPREGIDYFPLRVDYEEKLYAGGLIRGARFAKREGPPSDQAIVTARLIDHAIRPLFPKDFMEDVQVTVTVLSVDEQNDPGILALIATSAALHASSIPWNGPLAALRLGLKDGEFVINPAVNGENSLELEAMVSTVEGKIMAIEAEANEVPEEKLLEGIKFAQPNFEALNDFLEDFAAAVGKKKRTYEPIVLPEGLVADLRQFAGERIKSLVTTSLDKVAFVEEYESLLEEVYAQFEGKYSKSDMKKAVDEVEKKAIQDLVLKEGRRVDGRGFEEIRPLEIEVGILPRTHGSSLFSRGLTQALSIVTLGSSSLEQLIQSMTGEETKRYMHHYYGRPFSFGDTGPIRGPGRREIGHGALAEKALRPVIPSKDDFPYAIRVVTEILSQNGSTSMAATCGSSLALMDAGVPISRPVAGLSIGLMTDPSKSDSKQILLTDIVGLEDFNGYMDFKIAGTRAGITAIQMELKMRGIPLDLVEKAVYKSREKRQEILAAMEKVIERPREELSKFAPSIKVIKIDPKKIGEVIGPGGKVIKSIIDATGCEIDIEEDGTVLISAGEGADPKKAVEMVENIVKEVKVGEIYEGEVKGITDFGAFVEILPGKEGLLHISEISHQRTARVEDVLSVGDKVRVKVLEVGDNGKISLSRKALLKRDHASYRTPYHQKPSYQRRRR
jgi:polyribonucleotide nucleotidyltransferase